ncbi:MAG: glutaminase [Chloroflexota bacterium]
MTSLTNLTSQHLSNWLRAALPQTKMGETPHYIPLLKQTNPKLLAVCILTTDNHINAQGNIDQTFPLMSIIKPFLLLYLLSEFGQKLVFTKVGCEPSNYPFNSLEQLQIDQGFPRNPMINSGAITLASLLTGTDGYTKCQNLQKWLNKQGNCNLFLDEFMLNSVRSFPNIRNQAIIEKLTNYEQIQEPKITLDTYHYICCLSGTITDLARLGLLLVKCPNTLLSENCSIVREVMTTCGLYEASASFEKKVGFPTKSGVSGAILSLVPKQGAIACYSPPLDAQGNSVASLFIIQKIAEYLRP